MSRDMALALGATAGLLIVDAGLLYFTGALITAIALNLFVSCIFLLLAILNLARVKR